MTVNYSLGRFRELKREIDQALFAPVNFSEIGARSDLADLIPNPVREERRLGVIENDALLAVEPALALVDLGDDRVQAEGQ